MTRRGFVRFALLGGAAVIAAAGAACYGSGSSSPDTQVFTSSLVNDHTHVVTMSKSEIQSPPAAGITLTTSANQNHTHTLAMTRDELTTVNGGTTVSVLTSTDQGHNHSFMISKWF